MAHNMATVHAAMTHVGTHRAAAQRAGVSYNLARLWRTRGAPQKYSWWCLEQNISQGGGSSVVLEHRARTRREQERIDELRARYPWRCVAYGPWALPTCSHHVESEDHRTHGGANTYVYFSTPEDRDAFVRDSHGTAVPILD